MFSEDETDAVILGLRLVAGRGDGELAGAAEDALAKIVAVLPRRRWRTKRKASGLLAAPGGSAPHLATLRRAIRAEEKLALRYVDKKGAASARTVWPIAVGFFEAAEVMVAWCEARQDFRHFRLDRIAAGGADRRRAIRAAAACCSRNGARRSSTAPDRN